MMHHSKISSRTFHISDQSVPCSQCTSTRPWLCAAQSDHLRKMDEIEDETHTNLCYLERASFTVAFDLPLFSPVACWAVGGDHMKSRSLKETVTSNSLLFTPSKGLGRTERRVVARIPVNTKALQMEGRWNEHESEASDNTNIRRGFLQFLTVAVPSSASSSTVINSARRKFRSSIFSSFQVPTYLKETCLFAKVSAKMSDCAPWILPRHPPKS